MAAWRSGGFSHYLLIPHFPPPLRQTARYLMASSPVIGLMVTCPYALPVLSGICNFALNIRQFLIAVFKKTVPCTGN